MSEEQKETQTEEQVLIASLTKRLEQEQKSVRALMQVISELQVFANSMQRTINLLQVGKPDDGQ